MWEWFFLIKGAHNQWQVCESEKQRQTETQRDTATLVAREPKLSLEEFDSKLDTGHIP